MIHSSNVGYGEGIEFVVLVLIHFISWRPDVCLSENTDLVVIEVGSEL